MGKPCSPVQDVADSCRTGAATNVIFGLALGYKSVIIPIFAIAIAIYVSFSLAAMYGIAVAALGMLSTIATGLAIDAYGPISDNAGGIAEMAGMSHNIRKITDALDAAGNTTAAIGKVGCYLYVLPRLLFWSLCHFPLGGQGMRIPFHSFPKSLSKSNTTSACNSNETFAI